jgi:hypothetical protein
MSYKIYPLDEIPYKAYLRIITKFKHVLQKFNPTNMEDDLKLGSSSALIFWYPDLVNKLFELQSSGKDYKEYLDSLHPYNYYFFTSIFYEDSVKLDLIKDKKIKNNSLNETIIK